MNKITLIDGRELECYPKAQQPEIVERNVLAPDTTGEYLQIGKSHKFVVSSEDVKARGKEIATKCFIE